MPQGRDLVIAQLGRALTALREAKTIQATKKVLDIATAAETYAKRQKMGQEAIDYAHTIKVEALAQLGRIWKAAAKQAGGRGRQGGGRRRRDAGIGSTTKVPQFNAPPSLNDLHLNKKTVGVAVALANLPPEEFEKVKAGTTTVTQVKRQQKDNARRQLAAHLDAQPLSAPEGPFDVIVIDPPWHYDARPEDASHRARNPYPDMSVEEICALDLPSRLAPDAIVWIWTTNAFMRSAYDVADAWKLDVKTILTWTKNRMGLGDWLRGQTEHCLLCVRGRPVVTLTNQTTALSAPLREHSRKPDEFYVLVDALCHGRKLEWFARTSRPGWAAFGAEASKFSGAAA